MPQVGPAIAAAAAWLTGDTLLAAFTRVVLQTFVLRALSKTPKQGALPINVTIRSTVAARQLVFGQVRCGGAMLDYGTYGSNNKYLVYVVAFAGHQTEDALDGYLDKYKVAASYINNGTGAVTDPVFDGKLTWRTHRGTGAQTADSLLTSAFPSVWTANHRLAGISYDVIQMERSDKAFPNGAPQMVNRVLKGALVYDSRLDSTNGGAGTHRYGNPSTWAYSRNLALGIRWFLTGGSVVNDQATCLVMYGVKTDNARLDEAFWIAAANKADESVSGANAPPSGAQARYTLDYEANCEQSRRDILEAMLAVSGGGALIQAHGKWRLYLGAYDAPVHAFTQDDLHGDMEIDDTTGAEDRFNSLSAKYRDAARDYSEQTSKARTDAAYVTQDKGKALHREIPLDACSDEYRAQRICNVLLGQARQMRTVKLRFGRQGLKVAPWETFTMDHSKYSWSGKVFRCIEREVERDDDGAMRALITARAESSAAYTDPLTADYTTGTSVTNALQSEPPDAPTSLVALPQARGILFRLQLGAFWERNGNVELWEYTASTPFSSATKVATFRGTEFFLRKDDTVTRYYWVRVSTTAGQSSSTEPASTGLAAAALPSNAIVSDPQFKIATTDHWELEGTTVLSTTGGNVGGYAEIDGNPAINGPSGAIYSIPFTTQGAVRGEVFSINCRIRRKPASATPEGFFWARALRMDAPKRSDASTTGGSYGGILIAGASIPTDWTEYTGLCFIAGDFNDAEVPYICAHASYETWTSSGKTDGEIQIDQLNLVRGSASAPFVFTFTSSTTLQNFDPAGFGAALGPSPLGHALLRYNSASPGTLTLPSFYVPQDVGLQLTFEQVGAGALTIGAGSMGSRTPNGSTANRTLTGQYAKAVYTADADGTWHGEGQF